MKVNYKIFSGVAAQFYLEFLIFLESVDFSETQ